jgi:DNA modification methylase
MPESAKNRFTNGDKEYVFFLTKKPSGYTFNGKAVAEAAKWSHDRRAGKGRHIYKETRGDRAHTAAVFIEADGTRKRRSVWTIETAQTKVGNHNATFPEELAEICIRAGSNEGDTVLDPFVGLGTSGVVAKRLGRNFVGVDVSNEYVLASRKRIRESI